MPRFVILEHDWPQRHWDLLLEADGGLRAWRLWAEPAPGASGPAEPAALHRAMYLDYEGPVGGGRGTVKRFAAGTFAWVEDAAGRVVVETSAGRIELSDGCDGWRFQRTVV